jgi:hypothetical protein
LFNRVLCAGALALTASLCLATGVQAGQAPVTATFEDRTFSDQNTYQVAANQFTEQGLSFSGGQFDFVPPGNEAVSQPLGFSSVFMETYLAQGDTSLLTLSLAGGGAFNLLSFDLGLGDFNASDSDVVALTGTKANCATNCAVTANLTVGAAFGLVQDLSGFSDLSSVSFGPQSVGANGAVDSGYLAFDNISVLPDTGSAAPEPSAWALLIAGFGAAGSALRRSRAIGRIVAA